MLKALGQAVLALGCLQPLLLSEPWRRAWGPVSMGCQAQCHTEGDFGGGRQGQEDDRPSQQAGAGEGRGHQNSLSRYGFREKCFVPLSNTKLGFMSEAESIFKT